MMKLRVGIDFGYGYTGIALLDSDNKVLSCIVLKHRTDLSGILLSRRTNRAMRRRNKTHAARLRNFRALLKGIGLEPVNVGKGQKQEESDRQSPGNRLYALAQRRGWDYSSLTELLVTDDDKAGAVVRKVDGILLADPNTPQWVDEGRSGKRPRKKIGRKGEDKTCLGALAEWRARISHLEKERARAEKQENSALAEGKAEEIAKREREYEELFLRLDNADKEEVERWLHERLAVCGIAKSKRAEFVKGIMPRLGLDDGTKLHEAGELYAPNRNRHRNEFVKELREMMGEYFSLPEVAEKLRANAARRGVAVEEARELWLKNAVAILDPNNPGRKKNKGKRKRSRDVRPARFDNRHIGKCPAKLPPEDGADNGRRCGLNLPKKSRADIRKLQFEIEARMMNIRGGENGERKLTDGELSALMKCADFDRKENGKPAPALVNGGKDWDAFFKKHPTPPVKNEARGKKEILKDIAVGAQGGRGGLCAAHLREKLELLKAEETKGGKWERLHGERELSIFQNDGAPSIRQKVHKVVNVLAAMLKKEEHDPAKGTPPLEHIGIETARFDISALAQNEGKKLKKKRDYQSKGARDLGELRSQQNGLCLYCGGHLGRDATVDHIFPKAMRGSDRALNRAAAHAVCNINKGKSVVRADETVLGYIVQKGEERKANWIREMQNNPDMRGDSLSAPQHTMVGAKLLKGSLMDAFKLRGLGNDALRNMFPVINSRETAHLRGAWFPLMSRQKQALRCKPGKNVMQVTVGEKTPKPLVLPEWFADYGGCQIVEADAARFPVPEWIEIAHRKNEKGRRTTTLKVREGRSFRRGDEGVYVLAFNAESGGKIQGRQYARIAVLPAKDDPVHDFHHALDSVICAAKVDWKKLALLGGELRPGDGKYEKQFARRAKAAMPAIGLDEETFAGGEKNYVAPAKHSFLIADKQDQSGPKRAKTDAQPLRVRKGEGVFRRKALYEIPKKAVREGAKGVVGRRMRELLREVFAKIEAMPEEKQREYLHKRANDVFVTQKYFLDLEKNDPLHPIKARGALCEMGGVGEGQMWALQDRKSGAAHHFKRTVAWGEAVVYEFPGAKGKVKTEAKRFLEPFYVNAQNPQTVLPAGAKVIARFRRGDTVTAGDSPGLWKITKLGPTATLKPRDDDARGAVNKRGEATAAYTQLKKDR